MSAQVTEAHRATAETIFKLAEKAAHNGDPFREPCAQLIANSEATAVAEWQESAHLKGEAIDSLLIECDRLHAEIKSCGELSCDECNARTAALIVERGQLRAIFPQICEALGNGACCAPDVSVEFIQSIPNEVAGVVSGLRADVKRLKADGAASAFITMSCRASRAETDRNNLRADLDAIKAICNEETARAERAEASLHALRLVCGTTDADRFSTWVDRANARAEKAEAELKAEQDNSAIAEIELKVSRAIVSKIWVQLGSPTYQQLKGRSIYDLIDELKAELAAERARLRKIALAACKEAQIKPMVWYPNRSSIDPNSLGMINQLQVDACVAAIDAAMKEETK